MYKYKHFSIFVCIGLCLSSLIISCDILPDIYKDNKSITIINETGQSITTVYARSNSTLLSKNILTTPILHSKSVTITSLKSSIVEIEIITADLLFKIIPVDFDVYDEITLRIFSDSYEQ